MNPLKIFFRDEDGAVTVDWVVLTGAIVLLAAVTGYGLATATEEAGEDIGTDLADMTF